MMKIITKADFLSRSAKFTFNDKGDVTYQTFIGGIISLISIIGSLSLCTYFLFSFFKREETSVVQSTTTDQFINNTYSHLMPILIRITDTNSKIFENADYMYNITLKFWYGGSNDSSLNGNAPQISVDIEMEKCVYDKHISQEYKKALLNFNELDTYYCPIIRNYNQTLYGIYGSVFPFSYYSFTIRFCQNSTENQLCYPLEYTLNKLEESYLEVLLIDYSLDSFQKKQVGTLTYKRERFMISSTMFKRIWLYLENIQYIIDEGYIFTKYEIQRFHRYNSVRFDVDSRDTTKVNYFSTLTILNTSQTSIYFKNYLKIQDLFAILGGIIKAFTMFGTFANYFNSLNCYYFKLITDFILENNNDKNYRKFKNTSNISLIHIRNQLSGFKFCTMDLKNTISLYQKDFIKKRVSSSLFPIRISSKNKKYKNELFMLITELNKRLNIITVLKKLETINLINRELHNHNFTDIDRLNQNKIQKKINNYLTASDQESCNSKKKIK